jgi:putative flippase GtrA
MKKIKDLKIHSSIKFGIVGTMNTALDFTILNVLTLLVGLPAVVANTISATTTMIVSFIINKKWSFNSKSKNYLREIILFFVCTAFGAWVINNGIIAIMMNILPESLHGFFRVNISKVLATCFSMVWNYFTYRHIVFKEGK